MSFNTTTLKLNESLSKVTRKEHGIYFTPKPIRDRLFEVVAAHMPESPATILEPSFGSGEFLEDAKARFPGATITGVEFMSEIYNAYIKAHGCGPTMHLGNMDFMAYKGEPVDLIIGNPPYVVTKQKEPGAMWVRGNLFVLFTYKCLKEHLKPNGILAFVLPTSFYNCSYYEPCRRYIRNNATILHVENLDGGFYDTNQDTMLLVIQKKAGTGEFFFERGGNFYITPHAAALKELVAGTETLASLQFRVKTGEVVWNQEKESLTEDPEGAHPVLYSSNIVDGQIVLHQTMGGEKKQYIKGDAWKSPLKGPALLVSRGYGNKYHFHYARVAEGLEFFGENHVNVITPKNEGAAANMGRVEASLSDERTAKFIQMFVGNGALSKTEIECVLPIF